MFRKNGQKRPSIEKSMAQIKHFFSLPPNITVTLTFQSFFAIHNTPPKLTTLESSRRDQSNHSFVTVGQNTAIWCMNHLRLTWPDAITWHKKKWLRYFSEFTTIKMWQLIFGYNQCHRQFLGYKFFQQFWSLGSTLECSNSFGIMSGLWGSRVLFPTLFSFYK